MSETQERPALYEFIAPIVDDVREMLCPGMTRDAVEQAVGPIACKVVHYLIENTLHIVAEDIVTDEHPWWSTASGNDVHAIAHHVRTFLEPRDGTGE